MGKNKNRCGKVRFAHFALVMAILLAGMIGASQTASASSKKWFGVKKSATVFDLKNKKLGILKRGYCYPYTSKSKSKLKISYYGKKGYVNASEIYYLRDVEQKVAYQPGCLKNIVTLNTTTAMKNKEMLVNEVATVGTGTKFRLLGSYKNAFLVKMDGTYAYIPQKDCKIYYTLCADDLKKKHSMITTGDEVASFAKTYVGSPFIWGGTNLGGGCDSAGFATSVFAHFGYRTYLEKTAEEKDIMTISIKNLEPGDLVFYHLNPNYNHVGIFIGNGKIVHAKDQSSGVVISSLYYKTPAFALRVL